MLIVFDYVCTKCGKADIRYVTETTKDAQSCGSGYPHCGAPLTRQLGPTRTSFRFADKKLKRRAAS
jgi:hypothetical protein